MIENILSMASHGLSHVTLCFFGLLALLIGQLKTLTGNRVREGGKLSL